jgi:hypothetical protein
MTKYFYKGVPLKQYCEDNNIKYYTLLYRIRTKHMTVDEAVNKPLTRYLTVDGKSLQQISKEMGLAPTYFYTYLSNVKKYKINPRPDATLKEIVEEIVSGNKKPIDASEYFASAYCRKKGYNYRTMYQRYYYYKNHDEMSFLNFIKLWEKEHGYSSETAQTLS